MRRYKLARIVNGQYLSANQCLFKADGKHCLEYIVGQTTSIDNEIGIACYKTKRNALKRDHIGETKDYNNGKPIALLTLQTTDEPTKFHPFVYSKAGCYSGGINYPSVMVLEAMEIKEE